MRLNDETYTFKGAYQMVKEDSWEQFEKTGKVHDYLSFVACTREEKHGTYEEEGGKIGNTDKSDGYGIDYHASWRL